MNRSREWTPKSYALGGKNHFDFLDVSATLGSAFDDQIPEPAILDDSRLKLNARLGDVVQRSRQVGGPLAMA